ncbi:MAG TPA: hypothetical protein VH560_12145, partial [Polyangia bacterium]|nr:hypothetical protein [Polyangia bacterium]
MCVVGVVGVAIASCRDGASPDLSAPDSLTPGHASLAIAPRFASLPTGAPSITLATVKGLLISSAGDTT